MKQLSLIEKIVVIFLLVAFGGVVLHAPFTVMVTTMAPEYSLLAKAWKEILLGVACVLLVYELVRHKRLGRVLQDRLVQVAALYALVHFVLLIPMWQGLEASLAGLLIDLRYVLFFVLVYIVVRLHPQLRPLFLKVGVAGAVIVLGFALLQVFVLPPDILRYLGYGDATIAPYLTVDRNEAYVRINSTLRGPNPVGAYALIVLTALVAALAKGIAPVWRYIRQPRLYWRWLVLGGVLSVGGAVALWCSYSRSALVATVVSVGIVLGATVARRFSRQVWVGMMVGVGVVVGMLAASWNTPFVQHVLLHENVAGGSAVSSNDEHAASLETGFRRLLAQPFGAGAGSTGSASLHGDAPIIIENQYLFIAHEVGWLGLALFFVLFGVILVRLWRNRVEWLSLAVLASGVGLALIGILLPVWADDTIALVWWGLAAVALVGRYPHDDVTKTT